MANSPHVDAITGATTQSEALKKAVSRALTTSSKEYVIEEGGNPNAPVNYDVVVVGTGGPVWRRRFRRTMTARAW